ncbi:hypothetical protein AGLY_016660 [Aphis glycines]|uniref:DDE-1 domain-containing protein n=1 Tax=Aphis glycines TaxID=307491 RepID=A0A6G0SXH7_APHGL|nr:hypothetical protein AGLY_016660 [Aphis glycines]
MTYPGRRGMKSESMGRPTALETATESKLAGLLKVINKYGYGLSRKEVLNLVGNYVISCNIKTPFRNGYPDEDWWFGFSKRQQLSIKKPQIVEHTRKKACDPFLIYGYFDLLWKTLVELNLIHRPDRVWNLDETSFCHDPSKTKIVGGIGISTTRTTHGSGRDNTSVLMACSAIDQKGPPLIIFKGKSVWDKWVGETSIFPGTTYAATTNGWMEKEVFYNYFEKSFIKSTNPTPENPVLLIYDGHSSHVDLKLIDTAIKNNVTIMLLPPHSSHLLQPLDLAVFKSIKNEWDKILCSCGQKLPKSELPKIICNIWTKLDSQIIKNGFRKSGIYPFNRTVVERSKFDPLKLSRYDQNCQSDILLYDLFSTSYTTTAEEPSTSYTTKSVNIDTAEELFTSYITTDVAEGPTSYTNIDITECLSAENSIVSSNNSFEILLLNSMKQATFEKQTKRKITGGASVITSEETKELYTEGGIDDDIQNIIDINIDNYNEDQNLILSDNYCNLLHDIELEEQEMAEESYLHRTVDNIGDWILLKYIVGSKGKKIKHFVDIIKDKTDTNLIVKFVKLKKELKTAQYLSIPLPSPIT